MKVRLPRWLIAPTWLLPTVTGLPNSATAPAKSVDEVLAEVVESEMRRQVQVIINPSRRMKLYDRWIPLWLGLIYLGGEILNALDPEPDRWGGTARLITFTLLGTYWGWCWWRARRDVHRLGELVRYLTEPNNVQDLLDRHIEASVNVTDHDHKERDGWKAVAWWSTPDMPSVLKPKDDD